jgi:hypothetical protein
MTGGLAEWWTGDPNLIVLPRCLNDLRSFDGCSIVGSFVLCLRTLFLGRCFAYFGGFGGLPEGLFGGLESSRSDFLVARGVLEELKDPPGGI